MERPWRKRLRRAKDASKETQDAPVEAQDSAACDSGSQERRELSEPESVCQGMVCWKPLQITVHG